MKYWEIIADNLSKAGWSLGWVSAVDSNGRTIFIADAHRDGKRFAVHAEEKLTAFMEPRIGDSGKGFIDMCGALDSGNVLGLREETADATSAVEHAIKGRHRTVQARGHTAAS